MVLNTIRSKLQPLALTFLRVTVGLIMAVHGWDKLTHIDAMAAGFSSMGFANPQLMVILAIAGELGGGLGLLVGFLTPLAALGVFSTMAVAVFGVHLSNGLLAKNGGFEYPLTLLAVAFFFMIYGGGAWSLDAVVCRKCSKRRASGGTSCCG